jgi:CubicO group peptidase (beta-lactamase class C family)
MVQIMVFASANCKEIKNITSGRFFISTIQIVFKLLFMKKHLSLVLSMVAVTAVIAQNKKQTLQNNITAFDSYVQQAMQTWRVPGMAVAIVKDNEIVFSKGYGVREIGTDKKVDTKTYFSCASTTKAMTAMCMAILADQGKLQWTDPVVKYLPEFKLYDPYVTNELQIQDLFLHNSGVGNTDYLWGDNDLSADEILAKMQLVKPAYSFRSSFIYQNIFYLVAGKVIEKISGKPWHIFLKENIFDRLGMLHTRALFKQVDDENRATPHFVIDNKVTAIEKDNPDAIGPAGSVASCADDIALWMKCMIDSSKYTGGRLVKPATWIYLLKPKTLVTESEFYPTQIITKPNFTTYAMGWFQQDYKGYKLNFHTGSLSGETAIHAQLPDRKFGIYVFGNLDHAELRHALVFKAIDLFELGGKMDWSVAFKNLYDSLQTINKHSDSANIPIQILNTKPSLPLENYAGTYQDELYGTTQIILENNELKVIINNVLRGRMSHYHFNTFKTLYTKKQYPADYYTFQLNNDGKIDAVVVGSISYKRK